MIGDFNSARPTSDSGAEPLAYTSSCSFDRYEYIKTLGDGLSSTIVLVHHTPTHKFYALKIVPCQLLVDNDFL
jgi:serine/threonine protein kinase